MGDWNIYIEGTGIHHNFKEADANVIADRLVQELLKAGQTIHTAYFASGDRLALLPVYLREVPEILPGEDAQQYFDRNYPDGILFGDGDGIDN